jgi:hypothetical protein
MMMEFLFLLTGALACVTIPLADDWQMIDFPDWTCHSSTCSASLPLVLEHNDGVFLVNFNVSLDQAVEKEISIGLAGATDNLDSCELLLAEIAPH